MKGIDMVTIILIIVGGLNWGLVGVFSFDLVAAIFGDMSIISRIVYILVGLSALYQIFQWKAMQGRWGAHKTAA